MDQPYVISKVTERNQYLSSIPGSWTWVPAGSRRNEVLSFRTLSGAEKFAKAFTLDTGIQVEVITKWLESIDEIMDIMGIRQGPWEGRAKDTIGMLWSVLKEYPAPL